MQIVLFGLLGSGKTTVGKLLAKKLDLPFTDLDAEIEQRTGKSISKIFSEEGEERFRAIETETLSAILEEGVEGVLSLGGGTLAFSQNQALLNALETQKILLLAEPSTIYQRLSHEPSHFLSRPLLQLPSEEGLTEEEKKSLRIGIIENLAQKRLPTYLALSDLSIQTDPLTPREVCRTILQKRGGSSC